MTVIAIIGGGIAGNEAAVSARKQDPGAEITLLTEEPHPLYTACALADYVCGDLPRERLFLARLEDYERNRIDTLFSTPVSSWDPAEQALQFNGDTRLTYDRLILATGSRPFIPPIPGTHLNGVHTLKTLQDADRLKQQNGRQAVVVGSGPVGIESAIALKENGFRVTIIEQLDGILRLLFDRELSHSLGRRMLDQDVDLCLGETAIEIYGDRKVEGIKTDQREIPADTVVFAIGMRPEVTLAKAGGVALGDRGGITVDERMETSLPGVYACGDCVEYYCGTLKQTGLHMLWNNARLQGRIAGANAAGASRRYAGNVVITNVNVFDDAAAAIGLTSAQVPEEECKVLHRKGPAGELYLVLQKNRLTGAQAIGCTDRLGSLMGVMMRGDELDRPTVGAGVKPQQWALRSVSRELSNLL
jgi:NADH oxidase (H2O2-forming)